MFLLFVASILSSPSLAPVPAPHGGRRLFELPDVDTMLILTKPSRPMAFYQQSQSGPTVIACRTCEMIVPLNDPVCARTSSFREELGRFSNEEYSGASTYSYTRTEGDAQDECGAAQCMLCGTNSFAGTAAECAAVLDAHFPAGTGGEKVNYDSADNAGATNKECPAPPDPNAPIGGYSIQMLKDHLAPELGIPNVQVEMLEDNNAIMSSAGLLRPLCGMPSTLCIGAAAISITQDRETRFDFLASYFTNNVRILAPATTDPVSLLAMIVSGAWQLLLGLVVVVLCLWAVMTPVVWTSEMLFIGKDTLPIFQPPASAKGVVLPSLKAAGLWTMLTLKGEKLASPNSPFVKSVLTPLLLLGRALIGIIATAAMAAIFTVDATQAAAVSGLADLTPRHVVCYNGASSFNTQLVTQHASEIGFQTLRFDSTSAMFSGFFRSRCDAVIYDETLLNGELIRRREVTSATDETYGRVQRAGIVGASLKWDPYGFVMPSNHSAYEVVNRALVGVATDSQVRGLLESVWLHTTPSAEIGFGVLFLLEWVWIPAVAAAALLVVGLALVVCSLLGRVREATRDSVSGSKLRKVRRAKFEQGYAAVALQPADGLVHDMVNAARRPPFRPSRVLWLGLLSLSLPLPVFPLPPSFHTVPLTACPGSSLAFPAIPWLGRRSSCTT